MTLKRKNKNINNIFWALLVVLFVVAGIVAFFVIRDLTATPEIKELESSEQKEDEKPAEEELKEKEEKEAEPEEPEEKKIPQYEGDNPNDAADLTGAITAEMVQGDTLIIRTEIDQYLNGGTCNLTLSRAGATIYNSAATIQPNASNSTCMGFDVPVSELGAGEVQIIINISAGGKTGTIQGETKI